MYELQGLFVFSFWCWYDQFCDGLVYGNGFVNELLWLEKIGASEVLYIVVVLDARTCLSGSVVLRVRVEGITPHR